MPSVTKVSDLHELDGLSFDAAWTRFHGPEVDRNRLRHVEHVDTSLGPAYLKRFHGIQLKNAIKLRWSRPRCRSQAAREVGVIEALARIGWGVPEVLAWGEDIGLFFERRSFLLTAELSGRPLCERDDLAQAPLLDLADRLGSLFAAGLCLPDLGFDHVFEDGRGYSLIDFHNARTGPPATDYEVGRAVVRLFRSPGGAPLVDAGLVAPFLERFVAAACRRAASRRIRDVVGARISLS